MIATKTRSFMARGLESDLAARLPKTPLKAASRVEARPSRNRKSGPEVLDRTDPLTYIGTMEDQRDLVYVGVGPLAAILIGMALVPFRDFTSASNFTFVFLALIILVAELGGRAAALLTAVTAALSLNFFLTQPYLRLTIHSRDDVIAFAGLGACGLLAAALGAQRSRRKQDLEAARRHLQLLHVTLSQVEVAGPVEPALGRVLNALEGRHPVVRRRHSRRTEPRGRRLGPGLVTSGAGAHDP